jgi:IMP and pyridine-specific 5'-nucleotidase
LKIELPWCAFNGGRDAWVDVGDKSVGVAALQAWLGIACHETIHVGDQFLNVGNDIKVGSRIPLQLHSKPLLQPPSAVVVFVVSNHSRDAH